MAACQQEPARAGSLQGEQPGLATADELAKRLFPGWLYRWRENIAEINPWTLVEGDRVQEFEEFLLQPIRTGEGDDEVWRRVHDPKTLYWMEWIEKQLKIEQEMQLD